MITTAYPILQKHGIPFAVYLPTAFPDGLGQAWWLALEEMIGARKPHQPGDGPQGAAFHDPSDAGEI